MDNKERVRFPSQEIPFYPPEDEMRRLFEVSPYRTQIEAYFQDHGVSIERLFYWLPERRGLLSDIGILRHFLADNIVIDPFDIRRLQSNGYDVCLGEQFYAYSNPGSGNNLFRLPVWSESERVGVYDPLDPVLVNLVWGKVQQASLTADLLRETYDSLRGVPKHEWQNLRYLKNYDDDDKIIFLAPNQMILGHTKEFIGGRNIVSTTISGKSSVGRNLVEVCSDANLGDVGFISRWALELRNKSSDMMVILLVGQSVATIQFTEIEGPISTYQGTYQSGQTLEEIKANWTPEFLLPRMRKKL